MAAIQMVRTAAQVLDLTTKLKASKVFGFDTEFIRETSFFPKIALIQVANDQEVWLIDPLAVDAEALRPFFDLLTDTHYLKIVHAAYADQECLYHSYGVMAEPIFDTAVGASLLGMGDSLGLGRLVRDLLDITLPKGMARTRWLTRPLPTELIQYAEQDVRHLVPLTEKLRARLEQKGRWEWALEESRIDAAVFLPDPKDMLIKLSRNGHWDKESLAALEGLIGWREDRARQADLPRNWVADNETLVGLAKMKPRKMEDLRLFRGLAPKTVEKQGKYILDAIAAGLKKADQVVLPKRTSGPSDDENALLDFLKTFVSYLAAEHEIASRFLLASDSFLGLLRGGAQTPDHWVEKGFLSTWSAKMVGEDLALLLRGERALTLQGGRLKVVNLKDG